MAKYNPWEDKKTFLVDLGGVSNIVDFAREENIINEINEDMCLDLNEYSDYDNANLVVDLLNQMDDLSNSQYAKLKELDVLYSKYKYQLLLSQDKNNELISKLNDLIGVFGLFERNKIKIVNLMHNAGMTDTNVIKIKHSRKMDFIKMIKICINEYSSVLELIEFNENIHSDTINKLKKKITEIEVKTNLLILEFHHIKKNYLNIQIVQNTQKILFYEYKIN